MDIIISASGSYTVVQPSGRLGRTEAIASQKAFIDAIGETSAGVIVDCSKLEYVSSAGLRAFLVAAKEAGLKKVPFVVCNLSKEVDSVFSISGFDRIVPLHDDLDAATAALAAAK